MSPTSLPRSTAAQAAAFRDVEQRVVNTAVASVRATVEAYLDRLARAGMGEGSVPDTVRRMGDDGVEAVRRVARERRVGVEADAVHSRQGQAEQVVAFAVAFGKCVEEERADVVQGIEDRCDALLESAWQSPVGAGCCMGLVRDVRRYRGRGPDRPPCSSGGASSNRQCEPVAVPVGDGPDTTSDGVANWVVRAWPHLGWRPDASDGCHQ